MKVTVLCHNAHGLLHPDPVEPPRKSPQQSGTLSLHVCGCGTRDDRDHGCLPLRIVYIIYEKRRSRCDGYHERTFRRQAIEISKKSGSLAVDYAGERCGAQDFRLESSASMVNCFSAIHLAVHAADFPNSIEHDVDGYIVVGHETWCG
jgi:hypothetical protein